MSSRPFAASPFARTILDERYAWLRPDGTRESWPDVAKRVVGAVMCAVRGVAPLVRDVEEVIAAGKFIPGGRYLYATGRPYHQVNNCMLLRASDTREGWGRLMQRATVSLMTGAGVGVVYSRVRPGGGLLRRTGGFSSGPMALMQAINEVGRAAKQGGNRRAAIWAGLHWSHADVFDFIACKDWSTEIRAAKICDVNVHAPMDHTNISVILDDDFFLAYHWPSHPRHSWARGVFWSALEKACRTGDPGFSVDVGENAGEDLRNPCCEITSADDSDVCCLGSINLARIDSPAEVKQVVELATAFLLAGTVYSDVPYAKVARIREKNRRLGLGLMGVHEFQARHDYVYGARHVNLEACLDAYARSTEVAAKWADAWGLSRPVKTRAIAPTGTIGIIAETTTGIEPMFCAAYRRRYYTSGASPRLVAQYVIDPLAKRLVEGGADPDSLEDAMSLAADPGRRLAFQARVQENVDHGISSTINLPPWGSVGNDEDGVKKLGALLLTYLPRLRGVTLYPDGAHGGQPLERCSYSEAAAMEGQVVEAQVDVCDIRGGSCGS